MLKRTRIALVNTNIYLFPVIGQSRVAPDQTLHVVFTLSVTAEVDGVFVHMDVHQVIHDLALDVILHAVHQETLAYIDHLDEGALSEKHTHTTDFFYFSSIMYHVKSCMNLHAVLHIYYMLS